MNRGKMVDVDKLSDAELRTKLMEFGFPALPITESTRKIMVKKLKLLLENKESSNPDSRRSLGRYSSEDDSEPEVKAAKNKRRVTMAAPPPPSKAPVLKKTTRIVETTIEEDMPRKTRASVLSPRTYKIVKSAQDEFDTGSESESELVKNKVESLKKSSDSPYSLAFSSEKPTAFSSPVLNDGATERLNQIRSRLSTAGTSSSSYSSAINSSKVETPFLSNFTRRLSQLSAAKNNSDHRSETVKEHDSNGYSKSPLYMRSTLRPYQVSSEMNNKSKYGNLVKDNLVPFAVLGVAVLFFIFVGFVYLGMRSDTGIEQSVINVTYCDSNNRGMNCVPKSELQQALYLLKPLKDELHKRGVKKMCEHPQMKDRMEDEDVVMFVLEQFQNTDRETVLRDLHNLKLLIPKNPTWGISLTRDDTNKIGFSEPISLIMTNLHIPWTCKLKAHFYSIFKAISILVSIFGLVYVSYFAYQKYLQHLKTKRNKVICMVEKILEVLQNGTEGYVVINHVRDMLIPIEDRKSGEETWKQAVNFIEENESRVRTEVQVVQGEEYFVWRWIGSNLNTSKSHKSWQGQAFETQTGSVNSLPCSPTPCLKIRGMIEDGDRNTQSIKEAVLAKCASKCRILHCAVDANMKCVYMKCVDPSDAAVAYQNLHGWWYSGQLVTVKYLRLERYMQRFPDSATSGPPYLKATFSHTDGWVS